MFTLKPQAAVLLGVLAVSFATPLIKLSAAPAAVIAFYRLFLAALATLLLARGKLEPVPQRFRWYIFLAGIFLGLHFAVWIASLSFTSVLSSVALVTLQPVIVAVASHYFFKEHLPLMAYLGIALALAGGLGVAAADFFTQGGNLYGDLLAFLGAVFISGYLVLGRFVRSSIGTFTYTFWAYLFAALSLLPLIGVRHIPLAPYPLADWLIFAALALVCTLLGHSVFNWALAYLSPTTVTVAILGEPVGACWWDYLFFGQLPNPPQLIAGVLLMGGVALFLIAANSSSNHAKNAMAKKHVKIFP